MTRRTSSLALFLAGLLALPGGSALLYNGGSCGDPAHEGGSFRERLGDALTQFDGCLSPAAGALIATLGAIALAASAYLDRR